MCPVGIIVGSAASAAQSRCKMAGLKKLCKKPSPSRATCGKPCGFGCFTGFLLSQERRILDFCTVSKVPLPIIFCKIPIGYAQVQRSLFIGVYCHYFVPCAQDVFCFLVGDEITIVQSSHFNTCGMPYITIITRSAICANCWCNQPLSSINCRLRRLAGVMPMPASLLTSNQWAGDCCKPC